MWHNLPSSIAAPFTTSYSPQSPLLFAHSWPPVTPIQTPIVDSRLGPPTHFPVTCSMGLHWSSLTTLKRWPRRWRGVPVVVTIRPSIHPAACSPVSLVLPFGNHSTCFGQLPHVRPSPRRCLNSSSSHLSCDGLKGMLQPPHGPSAVIRCFVDSP